MNINKLFIMLAFISTAFIIGSCGSDLFIDPAGECVTCTYAASNTSAERIITACADGEGNITVSEAGEQDITSERSLTDFRLPHESSGANCQ